MVPCFEPLRRIKTIHEATRNVFFVPISCDFVDRSGSVENNTKPISCTTHPPDETVPLPETKIAGHCEAREYNQPTPQSPTMAENPFSGKEEPS